MAIPRVCPARAVGMNERWQFCLGAGLGTVATGNCTARLREAVPLQNRVPAHARGLELEDLWGPFRPKLFCYAVKAPSWLRTSLGWWGHAPSSVTKCHLTGFWPPNSIQGRLFLLGFALSCNVLTFISFLKVSFQDSNPTKSGFLHCLCFSLHGQLSVPEQRQWLGFGM